MTREEVAAKRQDILIRQAQENKPYKDALEELMLQCKHPVLKPFTHFSSECPDCGWLSQE